MITIRPFQPTEADYEALANIRNRVFPDHPLSANERRQYDEKHDKKCFRARLFAEIDGTPIGVGQIEHMSWMFNPQIFLCGIQVLPEYRRRGAGSQLYAELLAAVADFAPHSLLNQTREDDVEGLRFSDRRGFIEERRIWESVLNVATFEPQRFAGAVEQVLASGITISSAAELQSRDPDFWRKIYAIDTGVSDSPSPEPLTPPDFDTWIKYFVDSPNFIPEGMFIACDGDHYVGATSLWRHEGTDSLETGFTGVFPEYRRRGIALALKLRALDYARQVGAPSISTENDSTNRGMLHINEALGFAKRPGWITMRRVMA